MFLGINMFRALLRVHFNPRKLVLVAPSRSLGTSLGVQCAWQVSRKPAFFTSVLFKLFTASLFFNVRERTLSTRGWGRGGEQNEPNDPQLLPWQFSVQLTIIFHWDNLEFIFFGTAFFPIKVLLFPFVWCNFLFTVGAAVTSFTATFFFIVIPTNLFSLFICFIRSSLNSLLLTSRVCFWILFFCNKKYKKSRVKSE